MHGRLKVKTTAEQQEAKRKERAKKVKIYTGATRRLFEKRKNGEYDKEALTITGELLAANPDFYTLWNFRKEIFQHMKSAKSEDELQLVFDEELSFLESCLRVNPKSYGSWEQRCWIMENAPSPNWKKELELCNKYLEYDERNFHCWDYRRFVVKRSKVTPEAEFEFTTQKISSNFSNYSSWHYRSKMLPVIYPEPTHPVGVQEDILLKEFELAQNAFFTDPNDQSAWFYHRWLLGRGEKKFKITCIYADRKQNRIMIRIAKPMLINKDCNVVLNMNGQDVDVDWTTVCGKKSYSVIWLCEVQDAVIPSGQKIDITVCLTSDKDLLSEMVLHLDENKEEGWHQEIMKPGTLFNFELSATTSDILTQELESCQQLFELEPDNKWTLLTIVLLMRAIDALGYEEDTLKNLEKLKKVDSCRSRYYDDLKSKCIIENKIEETNVETKTIDLSNRNLTALNHHDYLCLFSTINLCGNHLESVSNCQQLVCVKSLNLDQNRLETCSGLENLPYLEELSLRNNSVESLDGLKPLASCKALASLDLTGNNITAMPNLSQEIRNILPSVKTEWKSSVVITNIS